MAPSKKAGKKVVTTADTKKRVTAGNKSGADWKDGFKKKHVGLSDMTLLTTISDESVNDNLQKRWLAAEIYTYIGSVLISVNPFRDLGIYTDSILASYRGKNRLEAAPHVFAIAESAYYNMQAYRENQCVIISGESGAGKTEAAKRIMQYIAAVSGGGSTDIQQIKDMVLATNPLLESFGCAKTLRNNNSSRHGKYLEIMFNEQGEPVGAQITNYLLEKGRVVGQVENERDFHIFYQFTKGASEEQRESLGIQGPEAYAYTSRSNCLEVAGIDDLNDFVETNKAMQVIGLSREEQADIYRMLAAILWLGNVQYDEKDDGNSQIRDTSVTDFVAYLLEVEPSMVEKVMTSKVVETQRGGRRGSVYDVPLNPSQAAAGRDALAKAIYNNLFEWIVARINTSMKPRQAHARLIGILDIFGFEIFESNSFEQLCINYVNEKLQQIFIELTLKTEQEEYVREEIKWTPIDYFNNKIVCDLIEARQPPGVLSALNDACATAHADPTAADNSFVQRLSALSSNPHFDSRGSQFLVRHYAGDVMYDIPGMTDKNKDALIKDLLDLVASSSNSFLQRLFPDRPDPNNKKRPPTAGDKIKASAGALVDNLKRAQPSYIRTIKPNQNRSATEYDSRAILHQIKYLGLKENIRVRRAGFAYRNTFEKMVERFFLLSPATSYAGEYIWPGDARSGCERILKDTGIAKEEWQMGVTKAFIKTPETLFALETMRDRYWHNMAIRIQRAWRNYMRYKHECARRIQRFWKNNKDAIVYAQVRDYGHQVLASRKERRRFSLLSYRRFFGDYLDVGGKNGSPLGETIREACGFGSAEDVSFSAQCQLLVSKFGRSSTPSPRYIVITSKAVYLVLNAIKGGVVETLLDRKILIGSIKSISTTNLRDDWFALNQNASEEGDAVLSCYFKTELCACLLTLTQARLSLLVGPTIEYSKKKDKKATIKAQKDETVQKDDVYKSHTIHVASGEPPGSVSRPPAKRKPGVVRPITQGKLLKKSTPSDGKPKPTPAARPRPVPQALPSGNTASSIVSKPSIIAAPPNLAPVAKSAPAKSSVATNSKIRNSSEAEHVGPPRAPLPPPPPPPPAAAAPPVEMYRAKFNFEGQAGEMSLKKDDLVELVEKEDNGWWLVKRGSEEGWAPNNYLEPVVSDKPKAPPPPTKRPPPSAPKPAAAATVTPKPTVNASLQKLSSVIADAGARPVAVFPGITGAGNGTSTPWKKAVTPATTDPGTSMASTAIKSPPPIAAKTKPGPAVATKPAPKVANAKPPVPTAPRPPANGDRRQPTSVKPPPAAEGQIDLATLMARRAVRPLIKVFTDYDDDYDKSYDYEDEHSNTIYLILGFFALGIWLVFKRHESIRNRPVEFSWPAPEPADPAWQSVVIQSPSLKSHVADSTLLPPVFFEDREYITCYDPSNGMHLATLPADSAFDIGEKLAKATNAQKEWKKTDWSQRRRVIRSLMKWLVDNREVCARVACRDTGKTMVDAALGEILTTCSKMEWILKYGEEALMPSKRGTPWILAHKQSMVYHEPLGVVAAIVSWNYPLHNAWSPILASIFAGNAVVVKCSEHVIWSTSWFVGAIQECLRFCGWDPNLVQLVACWPEQATALTQSPYIKHITFIGSEEVGRKVAQAATVHLTPVTLELGGKDPAVILPGTNIKKWSSIWMRGVFQNVGQNCIGIERFIIHESQYEEFVMTMTAATEKLRLGSVMTPTSEGYINPIDCGAMISADRFEDIERIIRDAESQGAEICCGGTRWIHPYLEDGCYFKPTVIGGVEVDMEIAQRELFAPIVVVMKYSTIQEAIEIANSTRYGLGASVFGPDQRLALKVAKRLECGMVAVNDFGVFYVNQELPFGGAKASGYGRFGGQEGLRALTYSKAITIDRLPWLINTSIPAVLDYPVSSLGQSWEFVSGLLAMFYAEPWSERLQGLIRLIRASS